MEGNCKFTIKYNESISNIEELKKIKRPIEYTINFFSSAKDNLAVFLLFKTDYPGNFWLTLQQSFIISLKDSKKIIRSLINHEEYIKRLSSIKKSINKAFLD